MKKSIRSMPSTFKMIIGLTLFYFICKTLGSR